MFVFVGTDHHLHVQTNEDGKETAIPTGRVRAEDLKQLRDDSAVNGWT